MDDDDDDDDDDDGTICICVNRLLQVQTLHI